MSAPQEAHILEAALGLLGDGPLPLATLVARLDATGLLDELREEGAEEDELAEVLVEEILGDDVWMTVDDRVFTIHPLVDGLVLTHRVGGEELDAGAVELGPDLDILDLGARGPLALAGSDGELLISDPLTSVGDLGVGCLRGPAGWLDTFETGDLVAFRRQGASAEVFVAGDLADGQREVDALRRTIDGRVRPGEGEEAHPLVCDALAADPGAFRRPVAPLSELLERAGLERRGFTFGRRGETWSSLYDRFRERRRQEIAQEWGFDACCRRAFDEVDATFGRFLADPDGSVDAAAVNENLGHGAVSLGFADYLQTARTADRNRLGDFTALLINQVPDRAAPALMLAGAAADEAGDVVVAEDHLRKAVLLDADFGPAAAMLARYQIDRSDIAGAIASLRHPDLDPDGPALTFLLAVDRPYRKAGRNQPCPCGSGRKFKQCCERNRAIPLAGRTVLLAFKLSLFASRPEHDRLRLTLAGLAVDTDDPSAGETTQRMAADSMILDLALWEGALATRYLDVRGPLLPADERELLGQFVSEPRRLLEVVAVDEGVGMELRDTRTGEALSVDERSGSVGREVGELLFARVVRLPGVNQLMGSVMDIPLRLRGSLIDLLDGDPDAGDLAGWYGAAIAPPHMANREGEPMVLCTTELTSDKPPDTVRAALDEILDAEDEADSWTDLWDEPGGERLVRGTVHLDGDRLLLEANSEVRIERLVAAVADAVPGTRIIAENRFNSRDLLRNGPAPAPAPEPLPAGLHEAVEELIQGKERDWLDESIPALAGLTPREAADDPSRREDLLALLREMRPVTGRDGLRGFDPQRLRQLLGL